jgi:hypothetical protein
VELGAGCDFWKLEWKAEQATERSGVGCGAWSGGFQKSWQNSAGSRGDESIGLRGLRRGFGPALADDLRGEVGEGLVGPPGFVALEPASETGLQRGNGCAFAQVDFFVLRAAPEALDEDVVHPAAFAIHADAHIKFDQPAGPFRRGELAALVGVEDLGNVAGVGQGGVESAETQADLHGVGNAQPSTRRECQSITAHRKACPLGIGTYVMSAHHT